MGGNISLESYFPWPVSPSDITNNKDDKDKNSNSENDTKDIILTGGSTDNIEEDLKIFKKYLKIAINKELTTNNVTIKYDDNYNDISSIVEQAKGSSKQFKEDYFESHPSQDSSNAD